MLVESLVRFVCDASEERRILANGGVDKGVEIDIVGSAELESDRDV